MVDRSLRIQGLVCAAMAASGALMLTTGCTEPARPPAEQPPPAGASRVLEETRDQEELETNHAQVPLAETRDLEVIVEGQRELRSARLFVSPQGYAIYVLPQVVMTAEEPGRDQAFARVDGEYFVRIERLDPQAHGDALRQNARAWLAGIGDVQTLSDEQIFHPSFRTAEFFLRASNSQVTGNVLIMQIDGGRYRFTMHLPHREPTEGIAPTFWAMLQSVRTVAPDPRPVRQD